MLQRITSKLSFKPGVWHTNKQKPFNGPVQRRRKVCVLCALEPIVITAYNISLEKTKQLRIHLGVFKLEYKIRCKQQHDTGPHVISRGSDHAIVASHEHCLEWSLRLDDQETPCWFFIRSEEALYFIIWDILELYDNMIAYLIFSCNKDNGSEDIHIWPGRFRFFRKYLNGAKVKMKVSGALVNPRINQMENVIW